MPSILLYTDQPLLAYGLEILLAKDDRFQFLPACHTLEELKQSASTLIPDVVLIELTDDVTLEVLHTLRKINAAARLMLWTGIMPTALVSQAVTVVGIRGILNKNSSHDDILNGLDAVSRGELYFSRQTAQEILQFRNVKLTRRQGQIVLELLRGSSNKVIATRLEITEGTVKVYMSRLFQLLDVADRYQLAICALKNFSPMYGRTPIVPEETSFVPRTLAFFQ